MAVEYMVTDTVGNSMKFDISQVDCQTALEREAIKLSSNLETTKAMVYHQIPTNRTPK